MISFSGKAEPLTLAGISSAADSIGVSEDVILAIMEVETSGCGFLINKRIVCRFEGHIFNRLSGKTLSPTKSEFFSQYSKVEAAMELDEVAALKATSWGLGQIMGFNAERAGYKTNGVRGMIATFADSEDAQLMAIAKFCKSAGLDDELRRRDWTGFASGYNGPAFHKNNYDTKLARAYEKFSSGRRPDIEVRSEQVRLMFAGLYRGTIDGIDGPQTQRARFAFLKSNEGT